MVITIYTDASYNKEYKRAGYAYWINSKERPFFSSGSVPFECDNSSVAELFCVTQALNNLLEIIGNEILLASDIDKVIVNTDSKNVINLVTNNRELIKKYRLNTTAYKKAMQYFKIRVTEVINTGAYNFNIEYRHVLAHNTTATNKGFWNDWCDRKARIELTKCIAMQLRKQKND